MVLSRLVCSVQFSADRSRPSPQFVAGLTTLFGNFIDLFNIRFIINPIQFLMKRVRREDVTAPVRVRLPGSYSLFYDAMKMKEQQRNPQYIELILSDLPQMYTILA